MEKSIFAKTWEVREKQSLIPRRMRNLLSMDFEEFKNNVLTQDPQFVESMVVWCERYRCRKK